MQSWCLCEVILSELLHSHAGATEYMAALSDRKESWLKSLSSVPPFTGIKPKRQKARSPYIMSLNER